MIVDDYNDFMDLMNSGTQNKKTINENMKKLTKEQILKLNSVQKRLDETFDTYKKAIAELENEKNEIVSETESEEVKEEGSFMQTRAGAKGKVFEGEIQDPTKEEMMDVLASEMGGFEGSDRFSAEEAIYWYAHHHHGGQNSNLYSVLSTSEYKPSRLMSDITDSDDDMSLGMYNTLVSRFGGDEARPEGHSENGDDMGMDDYEDMDDIESYDLMEKCEECEEENNRLDESVDMEKTKDGYIMLSKRLSNGDLFKRKYMDYTEKEAKEKFKKECEKEEKKGKDLNEAINRYKKIINY